MPSALRADDARKPRSSRENRIEARVAAEKKRVIERAAEIRGMSLTDFVVDTAYTRAVETVRAHEAWVLTEAQSAFVVDHILNPPEPTDEMRALVAQYFAQRQEPEAMDDMRGLAERYFARRLAPEKA